jgi:hypothetical protein
MHRIASYIPLQSAAKCTDNFVGQVKCSAGPREVAIRCPKLISWYSNLLRSLTKCLTWAMKNVSLESAERQMVGSRVMQIELKLPSVYLLQRISNNDRKSIGIRVEISEIHHDVIPIFNLDNPVVYDPARK